MMYPTILSLALICLSCAPLLSSGMTQWEREEDMKTLKALIFKSVGTVEPYEMYTYLTTLRMQMRLYKEDPVQVSGNLVVSIKDIDDLIEAYHMRETRCNIIELMNMRKMLNKYASNTQLYNYLDFMKRKLSQFCMILDQAKDQPEYFALTRQRRISPEFWF